MWNNPSTCHLGHLDFEVFSKTNIVYLSSVNSGVKVRFHHHIFPTNLMTNSLTESPHKQMSHLFVCFVSQKFVANQIGLQQTHHGNFASEFVIKFVAKM
jgi:hypothetical protein